MKKRHLALILSTVKIIFYIAVPLAVLILPVDYFDKGESVCLSVNLLDVECYACGLTSAMMHITRFDFETAFAYNMLSFIVFPLLSILWCFWFLSEVKTLKKILAINKKITTN
ncbi:MAG: DUF2752 domain-containing protein [Bacteroidetes bacterium]|nr:MAG: DUF2752 domain-containing protein [Bacteroidota bacterium]TAG90718.1 MAG: DUF2752 domain-containing protein [Bacteroidota bacterium]